MISHVAASSYPDLSPKQTAMLDALFWNGTVRARTPDGVVFTVTGCDCLWMHAIDVVPDDPKLHKVRGRIIDADTLASWVGMLSPLPGGTK